MRCTFSVPADRERCSLSRRHEGKARYADRGGGAGPEPSFSWNSRYAGLTFDRSVVNSCGIPFRPACGRRHGDASYHTDPFPTEVELARQALLVTFDEQTDPQLVRAALENLLRKGALRWVGLEGSNVQVWRTEDITEALNSQRRTG
jgi:hypothetical protein